MLVLRCVVVAGDEMVSRARSGADGFCILRESAAAEVRCKIARRKKKGMARLRKLEVWVDDGRMVGRWEDAEGLGSGWGRELEAPAQLTDP